MKHRQKKKHLIIGSLMWIVGIALSGELLVQAEPSRLPNETTIQYQPKDVPTPPIDPEHPETKVDPGVGGQTEGLLRLDFVPHLKFGSQEISDKTEVYKVLAQNFLDETSIRPNYLQVTDLRGELSGWSVTVRQDTPFQDEKGATTLKGAMLSFDKQWVYSEMDQSQGPTVYKETIEMKEIGASYPLVKAEDGKGAGTWTINFGSTGELEGHEDTIDPLLNADGKPVTDPAFNDKPMGTNSAITLTVPGKTEKKSVKYRTVLTWTISELT